MLNKKSDDLIKDCQKLFNVDIFRTPKTNSEQKTLQGVSIEIVFREVTRKFTKLRETKVIRQ